MAWFNWSKLSRSWRNRCHRPASRSLALESLEDRQLLTTVTLNPVKDNTLIQQNSGSTSNGAGDIFVGLNNDGNRIRRGLVDFDVAGSVPAGATINSVSLTMWLNRSQVTNRNIELHKVLADWGEANSSGRGPGGNAQTGDATWLHTFYNNQFWATPGGDFAPTVSGVQAIGASGANYTWTSTVQMVADVQSWLNDPGSNFGWLLKGEENRRSSKRFDSGESTNAARQPRLIIDYTVAAPAPNITVSDVTITEGNAGTANASFDVRLSAASAQAVSVHYATANGSAVAGVDYQASSGTVTFTPGQTVRPITVPIVGDAVVELNETFLVNLSASQNATIADSQGVGTITNDDSAGLTINDVTAAEGNSGSTNFQFTVTLDKAVDVPVSVGFSTADDTATLADSDYSAASGTLSFAGNANETKTITVTVLGDGQVEPDETFLVNLANVAAAGRDVALADQQGVGTIANDDSVLTSVTLTPLKDNSLIEDALGALSNGTGDIYVGQNANGDLARRGLVAFDVAGSLPAGAVVQEVSLTMYVSQTQVGDQAVELHPVLADWGEAGSSGNGTGGPAETGDATWLHTFYADQFWNTPGGDFSPAASAMQTVGAQGAFYTWDSTSQLVADVQGWLDQPGTNFGWLLQTNEGQNSAKRFASRESSDPALQPAITILYSEAVIPEISIGDAVVTEGASGTTSAQFEVTLSAPTDATVTVEFATADDAALAGEDYVAAKGTVTFAPRQTVQTITIDVQGDGQVEPDETFFVKLSDPVGATIVDNQGQGTILNDDVAVLPTLSIDNVTRVEGDDGTVSFVFTVTLNGPAGGPVSIDFTTADGTAVASQASGGGGDDGGGENESGENEGNENESGENEGNENESGENETGGEDQEENDHGEQEQEGHEGDEREGDENEREENESGDHENQQNDTSSQATGQQKEVNGLRAGEVVGDYTAASGTLNFSGKSGETLTITVFVQGDRAIEGDETFFVQLSNPTSATIADPEGTGTILNDDLPAAGVGVEDGVLRIVGTNEADRVVVNRPRGGVLIVFADFLTGNQRRRFRFADVQRIDVSLYAGNDTATIAENIGKPALIDGGPGNDLLRGGSGHDTLIGGEGDDRLIGRKGKDLVVGGLGADRLWGGGGQDLLIAGSTAFDTDREVLLDLMAEWTAPRSYADRTRNIRGTNHDNFSRRRNVDSFFAAAGENRTVLDDNAVDRMIGGAGRDWFFANRHGESGSTRDPIGGALRTEGIDDLGGQLS